ncbi:ABC-type transport system involved in multi-copper enzyme maturation permease subunit [Microbacterium endophyticum]|uniref:ABC-type transport system involved in multi-copper enzyme maturation permease subunit n=1 Tax=Microbacterium endophyticum TaxID=1526412 RepID=A0A7W4V300_9MICO|nr:ABC transporter permease [Microbacterium endophyticum]MBB2975764.1 ABC-type transport system involved in multi-copper enzyme maturation permease subunit [Microbacterium endophyticum]NIK36247.1 ABC-type transport system involved in multi-copper enzyme maturation permease subunit [Microbacterium endophyticum]
MSFARATRSELTKQFTTSGWWILAIVLVAYVGFTSAGLAFALAFSASGSAGNTTGLAASTEDLAPLLYSLATSVGYVFPLLIGTLIVTVEFRHKTLTPTFLATPARGTVLLAKLASGVIVGALFGIIALVATVGPAAGVLGGFGLATELGSLDTWALFARTVAAFVLWVLIGIGIGALVRNQVAAIVIVLAFTQLVEPIARVAAGFVDGLDSVTRFLPGAASDSLVGASVFSFTTTGSADALSWWQGGVALLVYAAVFVLAGHIFSWRRDVD